MSLARFRYFEKVARLGSIREAAEVLHVAPSAISRQIAHLEAEFGAELFERQARGMRLTPAGEIVLRSARNLLDGMDQARSALDDLRGLRRGHVRLWTVEGMLSDFVYPVLAQFSAAHPAVTFDLLIGSSDQLVDRLLEDEADLAVVFNPPAHRGIATLGEMRDPLLAIMRPDHEAAAAGRLSLAELARWQIALPDATFGMRHVINEAAAAARLHLQPRLVTNSVEALRGFARTGMGVALLTRMAAQRDLDQGQLAAVPLRDRLLRTTRTRICARRDRRLPAVVHALARAFGQAATTVCAVADAA
ncbi:LysR family transcriptional regulator [Roseomonas chloroacetimidivorans]|uniref:LysR family transcriptional regulator n=1 Tax=Roseomonas chloroacetimidivorans TaxID=1766656 RepID=UPI003C708985